MTIRSVTGFRLVGRSLTFASVATALLSPLAPLTAAEAQDWTTEADFEIGGGSDAGVTLWHIGQVRVSLDGSRIYVTERQGYGNQANLGRRVTVWATDGSLLAGIGPEGETRDFGAPLGIRLARSGFWVRYPYRLARFSDGRATVEAIEHPHVEVSGGSVIALAVLEDRSLIGMTRVSSLYERLGWSGGEPDGDEHLLHVTPGGDGWSWDTIADLDRSNLLFGVRARSRSSSIPTEHFAEQPFSDTDLFYLDPVSGIVGVVTRNGAPGEVGLHETTARGETTWRRRLELPAVPIPADVLQEAVEDVVEGITSSPSPDNALAKLPLDSLRSMVRNVLHLPSHRPPVTAAIATASGELWLRSAESSDTVIGWYALQRGDENRPPRRVVVPGWFRLTDATDTHVWGFRTYEEGVARVLGRRLVPSG